MADEIRAGAEALVMDNKDHVATALKDMEAGQTIAYRSGDEVVELKLMNAVPFGHKVAIQQISAGTKIRKYGEVIGRATTDIAAGEHVHVHNVEGIRGRGDQAKEALKV